MGLRADSARPQRVSGSARTDSQRAESARSPIASHDNFGDDSALSALTRTQWTAALKVVCSCELCKYVAETSKVQVPPRFELGSQDSES